MQIFEYLDCDLSVYARRNRPLQPDIVKVLKMHVYCVHETRLVFTEAHVPRPPGIAPLPLDAPDASRPQAAQHPDRHDGPQ